MSRSLVFAALLVLLLTACQAAAQASRPNVLLILADDQRWDTIAALGNSEIETPNIDRLAKEGFRFNNAYCMGSMVGAVCLPSRTMLITGQSLWKCPQQMRAKTAPAGTPLLPRIFNQSGYATFHCGKAGNSCTFGNAEFQTNIETKGRTAQSATEHADEVIKFLKAHPAEKPFFIYLVPPVPHDPRLAPDVYVKKYDPAKLSLSKNFLPDHPFDNGELRIRDEELAPHPRTPEVMKRHLADYYATISHLDSQVGRIMATLKERNLAENTIIVYSSDQGLAVGGRHGLMGKQNLYEHVKPPLIFCGPGIPKGESNALVYLFDLFPTLCELSGLEVPAAVEGKSLGAIISGKSPRVRETLMGAYRDGQRMIRDERWKLLKYNAKGIKNSQLFDLAADPDELHNLAADPKHKEQVARLEMALAEARKHYGDPVDFDAVAKAELASDDLSQKLANVKFEQYAEAPGYSEGPSWCKGEVLFCSGALLRVDADRKLHKYLEIAPAGTVLRGDGHLLICDNKHRALLDHAPDGKTSVVAEQWEMQSLRSLNDLSIDARGNVYWTDPEGSSEKNPVGQVFRLRPDGRVDRVAGGLAFPNGLDVDPASNYLYVIESQSKKILRYALPADNALCKKPELFYDLGGSGGDGCAFDAAGNLWVADFHRPDLNTGRITVLSPEAKVLAHLTVPAKVVSNIAFGGPAHDEIFCTTGEPPGVFHAKVGVKGFAGHPGKPLPVVRALNVVPIVPHADSATVGKIAKVAAEAKLVGEKLDSGALLEFVELAANVRDSRLRDDVTRILPAWAASATRHARDTVVLAEIKRLGGKATLEVVAPDWLRAIVGDESLASYSRIVEIDLNERTDGHKEPTPKPLADRITDEWLSRIADQTELRRLEISGTAVTSAGLMHLKKLVNLERLNVCLTSVDDTGFEHLAKLTKMKRMVICASKITGSGFAHLQGMKQLESINLHSAPASNTGLAEIGKLASLKRLEIVHTNVTDAGLAHLAGLVNLRQLHIHGPETTAAALPFLAKLQELDQLDVYDKPASNQTLERIGKLPKLRLLMLSGGVFDDEGVKHLARVTTLEELSLDSDKVTDASIPVFGGLTNLRKLNLGRAELTSSGRERLQTLLPNTEIAN